MRGLCGGHWCGALVAKEDDCRGDDIGFLALYSEDGIITGQACEAYEHDCHLIEGGRLDGQRAHFTYRFEGGYVDAKLVVKGDLMVGTFYASKCACDLAITMHRIDG